MTMSRFSVTADVIYVIRLQETDLSMFLDFIDTNPYPVTKINLKKYNHETTRNYHSNGGPDRQRFD